MTALQGKTIINPIIKDEVTYVHSSKSTNGEKSVLDIHLEPKGGLNLHYHKTYDETFEVQSGELIVQIGKRKTKLIPGDRATIKRNEIHRFYSDSEKPTKFRATIIPGHQGFENSLAIVYGLASDGLVNKKGIPKSFCHLAIIATMSGTNLPGLFSYIEWIFKIIAKSKKSKKIKEELIKTYCL